MSETETLAAVLPSELSQAVKRRAHEEGRTVSNFIRQVLVNAVGVQRNDSGAPTDSAANAANDATR